jgi:prepilin-type processing-associated H-X9-DG protein
MKLPHARRRRILAFTIIELLVVIAIIGLMGGLLFPSIQSAMNKARSEQCAANLRSIGVAAMQSATDNNNRYPEIDQAATQIYPTADNAQGIVPTLESYGINTNTIQCPIDTMSGAASSFKKYGSSYEWNPAFDDENPNNPVVYFGTQPIPVNSTHVRLCTDFLPIHNGKMNAVYGDGHVKPR